MAAVACVYLLISNSVYSRYQSLSWDKPLYLTLELSEFTGDVISDSFYITLLGTSLVLAAWSANAILREFNQKTSDQLRLTYVRPIHFIVATHISVLSAVIMLMAVLTPTAAVFIGNFSFDMWLVPKAIGLQLVTAFAVTSAGLLSSCLTRSPAVAVIFSLLLAATILGAPYFPIIRLIEIVSETPDVNSLIFEIMAITSPAFCWLAATEGYVSPHGIPLFAGVSIVLLVLGSLFNLAALIMLRRQWVLHAAHAELRSTGDQRVTRVPVHNHTREELFPDGRNPISIRETVFGYQLHGPIGRRVFVWAFLASAIGWALVGWALTIEYDGLDDLIHQWIIIGAVSVALIIPPFFGGIVNGDWAAETFDGLAMTGLSPRAIIAGKMRAIALFVAILATAFLCAMIAMLVWLPWFKLREPASATMFLAWILALITLFATVGMTTGAITLLASILSRSKSTAVIVALGLAALLLNFAVFAANDLSHSFMSLFFVDRTDRFRYEYGFELGIFAVFTSIVGTILYAITPRVYAARTGIKVRTFVYKRNTLKSAIKTTQ